MAASLKGQDISSSWQNRAARRKETNLAVNPLREARKRLLEAAGATPPVAVAVDANSSVESLVKMADSMIASLATERARMPKFDQAIRQEETGLDALKENVRKAAYLRARTEVEQDASKEFDARHSARKASRSMKRLISLLIAAAIAFVLYQF